MHECPSCRASKNLYSLQRQPLTLWMAVVVCICTCMCVCPALNGTVLPSYACCYLLPNRILLLSLLLFCNFLFCLQNLIHMCVCASFLSFLPSCLWLLLQLSFLSQSLTFPRTPLPSSSYSKSDLPDFSHPLHHLIREDLLHSCTLLPLVWLSAPSRSPVSMACSWRKDAPTLCLSFAVTSSSSSCALINTCVWVSKVHRRETGSKGWTKVCGRGFADCKGERATKKNEPAFGSEKERNCPPHFSFSHCVPCECVLRNACVSVRIASSSFAASSVIGFTLRPSFSSPLFPERGTLKLTAIHKFSACTPLSPLFSSSRRSRRNTFCPDTRICCSASVKPNFLPVDYLLSSTHCSHRRISKTNSKYSAFRITLTKTGKSCLPHDRSGHHVSGWMPGQRLSSSRPTPMDE